MTEICLEVQQHYQIILMLVGTWIEFRLYGMAHLDGPLPLSHLS